MSDISNNVEAITILAERTWNAFYFYGDPKKKRRKWSELEQDTKDEWIEMFQEYEKQRAIYCVENYTK